MSTLPTPRHSLSDDLFAGLAPSYLVRPLHGDPLPQQIRLDVREDAENYIVQAELPGASRDDIHVSVDGPLLSITAELKQFDQQIRNERVLRTIATSYRNFAVVASREAELRTELSQAPEVVVDVPNLEVDVHDLGGLASIADALFPDPT